jgi:SSS family solute:Na+ symporter
LGKYSNLGVKNTMSMLDQWIVMVWGIAILGIGISAGLRSSALSFWINNRQTHLFLLISTIVATQVGGGTIFGIASSTRLAGTGYGLVATISIVLGFIIISFMAKRIFAVVGRREAFTMPEIIGIRHGRTAQMVAGFVVVMAYLSVLGVQILAVGLIVQMWSGASFNTALVLAGAGVVLYSAFAGLKGDIVTDVAHVIMLILVLFVLFPWFLCKQVNVGEILLHLPSEAFSPIRFGGYTYLVAGAIIGIMLPLVSMEQWMRIYAAENQRSASLAYFVSAIVILPFYLMPMVIGLTSLHTLPDLSTPDVVFLHFMFAYLPPGVLGIGVAALFAVLISTANTLIVVLSAAIYRDIWGRSIASADALRTSRILTLIVGCVGIGISLILPDIVRLILNASFWLLMLFPALIVSLYKINCSPRFVIASMATGVIVTLMASLRDPTKAFLPGLIIAAVIIVAGCLVMKHSRETTYHD